MPETTNLLLALVTLTAAIWVVRRWSRSASCKQGPAEDGPQSEPYRVYTHAFDCITRGRDVPALQEAQDGWHPSAGMTISDWSARLKAADGAAPMADVADEANTLLGSLAPGSVAAVVLIDQSGSMADRMIEVAAALRWLAQACAARAIPLVIGGFTTLGWRGGEPRMMWMEAGQPARPGRLAALLHIVYQSFGERMADEDWRAMLHPNALRENIDGEAIAWGATLLDNRPEPCKILIVVSDGAPVDDATMLANGPSYLVRHLRATLEAIAEKRAVTVGAVGMEHRVRDYYPNPVEAVPGRLVVALAQQIAGCASYTLI